MAPNSRGSFHLFKLLGINVYLHWSWFLVAFLIVSIQFGHTYTSLAWCVYEYLALFLIVLIHEFGHSLACRSVGGRADQILLWPLGGAAFVDPPQRPGATLWSIAAGPLVNVLLIPIFTVARIVAASMHLGETAPNLENFITYVWAINIGLLCFNLLPIYPLDGGQILRSILWFFLGRARSLLVASWIGMIAGVLFLVLFVPSLASRFNFDVVWLAIMAVFVLANCWSGLQQARILGKIAAAPRRAGLACPHCKAPPPMGNFWMCGRCRTAFDMFATRGVCPRCGTIFNTTRCLECGEIVPLYGFGEAQGQPPG
jgi:Zn-dependent protease